LQGEYRKVPGWMEDDMPVWRQVHGEGTLMSTSGHWVICECFVDDVRKKAQIRSSVPHGGQWPEQASMWKYSNTNTTTRGLTTDYVRAICVSTDRLVAERSQANYMYMQGDDEMDIDEELELEAFALAASRGCVAASGEEAVGSPEFAMDTMSVDEEVVAGGVDSV